ncbi:MAG: 2-hydroxyacyl-CoA dehydratase [Deltaproteobacteria bacterium]|nr:2-hydroxyacyl-CoA dehydratase [Deltaproteobacteria bacterium]
MKRMRRDVIAEQKRLGRKTVVALPVHYPAELFTAMDVHVVELWGPPGPPRGPDAGRIQPYVCAVVRNAMAFLADGGAREADALLFPHTCDSIQGMATLAPDFGGWGKPVLRYFHPKGEDRPAARALVRAELASLSAALELLTGRTLESNRLAQAVALHAEIHRVRGALLSRRTCLDLTDPELYRLLRRGEYLWPEDHLSELMEAAKRLGGEPVRNGVPLMVTGYVPEPMTLLDLLASAGAFLAADDYAAVGRRVPLRAPDDGDDPLAILAERPFALPPCPTRGSGRERRMDHLESLYRRAGAAGIVIHVPKFCEPEAFDVPAIRTRFAKIGAPHLFLEGELESRLSGQAATRLEAFVETVRAGRASS